MDKRISLTTVQKVRRFLTLLDLPPSPYASADEVMGLLVDNVKRNRGNSLLREQINELLVSLATESGTLPVFSCETVDAQDLADELRALSRNGDSRPANASPRLASLLTTAAALLCICCLQIGCGNEDSDPSACYDDLSLANFTTMMDRSDDLTDDARDLCEDRYTDLTDGQREYLIEKLCAMQPEDIAAFLEENLIDGEPPEDRDDDPVDGQVIYKGVTF